MQLIVNNQPFVDPQPLNKAGGEGELYALDEASVAKVYHDEVLTREPWRTDKVLALCMIFRNSIAKGTTASVAYPHFPAYEEEVTPESLVGFSMRWFDKCPKVSDLKFDIRAREFREANSVRLDDKSAIELVYRLFHVVDRLHTDGVVLADVNGGNFLYDPVTRSPIICDIDSAQVGSWPGPMTTPEYADPLLEHATRNAQGRCTFTTGTDFFALAVLCFELLVGRSPFALRTVPPDGDIANKAKGISSIRVVEEGTDYLQKLGVTYLKHATNAEVEDRVKWLKGVDPLLYGYFVRVFCRGERENLLLSLKISDERHPGNRFLIDSGAKIIIDKEIRKRRLAASAAAAKTRQGAALPQASLPESGGRAVVDSILIRAKKPAATKSPQRRRAKATQVVRTDPNGFAFFMQHFGLST